LVSCFSDAFMWNGPFAASCRSQDIHPSGGRTKQVESAEGEGTAMRTAAALTGISQTPRWQS
jgi:hypothetical protein